MAGQTTALAPPLHTNAPLVAQLGERPFALITNNAIRRGNCQSEQKLIRAIEEYLDAHNSKPKPLIWTDTSERILEKVPHFCKSIV
jgi:hypothetical protein